MTVVLKTERKICPVSPFGIEIDTRSNSDVIIQSIPGCKLRGAIGPSKMVKQDVDNKFGAKGDEYIPESFRIFGSLPPLPGMQLHVNPGTLEYEILDPLYEKQELLDRFIAKADEAMHRPKSSTKYKGLSPQKGQLDVDRMKTLVREMVALVGHEMAKVVKGVLPDQQDIAEMEGEFLLNPGSQVPNNQPYYEKDMDEYRKQLSRVGG